MEAKLLVENPRPPLEEQLNTLWHALLRVCYSTAGERRHSAIDGAARELALTAEAWEASC